MTHARNLAATQNRRAMQQHKYDEDERKLKTAAATAARKAMAARGDVPEYTVRGVAVPDLAMITDAWLVSYQFSPVTDPIPKDVYRVEQRARIRRIIASGKCICAVDPENLDRIKGWVVYEPPRGTSESHYAILHYVSVHPTLQNMGLGETLVNLVRSLNSAVDSPLWITHYTFPMRRLMTKWNLIYNPYLLEVPE